MSSDRIRHWDGCRRKHSTQLGNKPERAEGRPIFSFSLLQFSGMCHRVILATVPLELMFVYPPSENVGGYCKLWLLLT